MIFIQPSIVTFILHLIHPNTTYPYYVQLNEKSNNLLLLIPIPSSLYYLATSLCSLLLPSIVTLLLQLSPQLPEPTLDFFKFLIFIYLHIYMRLWLILLNLN